MSLTVVKGLQSEIYVPITPQSIFTPVTKPLTDIRYRCRCTSEVTGEI